MLLPRGNRQPTTTGTHFQPPGWQLNRMDDFNQWLFGVVPEHDLLSDERTDLLAMRFFISRKPERPTLDLEEFARLAELADFSKVECAPPGGRDCCRSRNGDAAQCVVWHAMLGGVDKFEPVSGGGQMDHAEEAVGELIVSGGDGAVDFQLAEHPLDAIALLVERSVMFGLHAPV
jgi:hypothetical protein